MASMVRWNLEELNNALSNLDARRRDLWEGRERMRAQQERIDANWQSEAGRQYQSRLQDDMNDLDHRGRSLMRAINCLRRMHGYYTNAESVIQSAASNLP